MSDFTDRARAEAQTRRDPGGKPCRGWHSRSDAHDKGFVSGAWWAAEQGPSDAEANSRAIARAQWPVLSAVLRRGLVADWQANGNASNCCDADAWHKAARQLLDELDRIDQELGIGSGCEGYCTCNGSNAGGLMGDCGIAAHRAEWRERHQSGGPS